MIAIWLILLKLHITNFKKPKSRVIILYYYVVLTGTFLIVKGDLLIITLKQTGSKTMTVPEKVGYVTLHKSNPFLFVYYGSFSTYT